MDAREMQVAISTTRILPTLMLNAMGFHIGLGHGWRMVGSVSLGTGLCHGERGQYRRTGNDPRKQQRQMAGKPF
jgi:hypothetical protein